MQQLTRGSFAIKLRPLMEKVFRPMRSLGTRMGDPLVFIPPMLTPFQDHIQRRVLYGQADQTLKALVGLELIHAASLTGGAFAYIVFLNGWPSDEEHTFGRAIAGVPAKWEHFWITSAGEPLRWRPDMGVDDQQPVPAFCIPLADLEAAEADLRALRNSAWGSGEGWMVGSHGDWGVSFSKDSVGIGGSPEFIAEVCRWLGRSEEELLDGFLKQLFVISSTIYSGTYTMRAEDLWDTLAHFAGEEEAAKRITTVLGPE